MYVVIFWRPEIHTHRTKFLPELHSPIILQTSNSLWAHTPICSHFPHVYLNVVINYILDRCHLERKLWSLSKKSEKCFQIMLDLSLQLRLVHLLKQKVLEMFSKMWSINSGFSQGICEVKTIFNNNRKSNCFFTVLTFLLTLCWLMVQKPWGITLLML